MTTTFDIHDFFRATSSVAGSWTKYGGANNRPVKIFDLSACGKHLGKVASVESLLGSLTQEGKLADRQMRCEILGQTAKQDRQRKQDVAKCK